MGRTLWVAFFKAIGCVAFLVCHDWAVLMGFFVWITRGLQATIWKNLSWGKQWIKKTLVKLSENMWVKFTKWFSFCVYDDSGSSRSWPATPTLWWWFLCMTRLEQMPYGSSSILVRTYAQILDSVHFNNMKVHFKKVTFLGYRIPSLCALVFSWNHHGDLWQNGESAGASGQRGTERDSRPAADHPHGRLWLCPCKVRQGLQCPCAVLTGSGGVIS